MAVKAGLPQLQGLILGLILFLLYMNDIPLEPTLSNTSIFADDATSFSSEKSKFEVQVDLQEKANKLKNGAKNGAKYW